MRRYRLEEFVGLQKDMLGIARWLGAVDAEDAVQDAWLALLDIERKEGGIDRLMYGDGKLNVGYVWAIIRTTVRQQKKLSEGMVPIQPDNMAVESQDTAEPDLLALVLNKLENIGACDKELFLDYMFGVVRVDDVAAERGVTPATIYNKIKKVKHKIIDKM